MGWAARANTQTYSSAKPRTVRNHFKRPDFKALWQAFDDRVGVSAGKMGRVRLIKKPE